MPRRRNKYGAVPKVIDGIRFASTREARRYQELRLLEKAGEIHALELQPVFVLFAWADDFNDFRKVGEYRADFRYCACVTKSDRCHGNGAVVEDVKGVDTPLSKWKRKHVKAQYGIDVVLV